MLDSIFYFVLKLFYNHVFGVKKIKILPNIQIKILPNILYIVIRFIS